MNDVDAVQAQIARNMLESGDWVTARLDGVAYLEKAPLTYWLIAVSYLAFGVHDWAARIPFALGAVALCWLVCRFGRWAFSPEAGMCAGLALATCCGLFLFTRILIADILVTLTITASIYGYMRAIEGREEESRRWALLGAAAMGCGVLLKGLIAVVFPVGTVLVYLVVSGGWRSKEVWRRVHVVGSMGLVVGIAGPWHILATLRNPPYFDFSLESRPGQYRGFFWFYFFNEHILRFLGRRYPRDYNRVPVIWFWLLNVVWLFPWSVFFPGVVGLDYRGEGRAERVRRLMVCWVGVVLVFFSFSTTQEYYSMPCYPALALLVGSVLAKGGAWVRGGMKAAGVIAGAGAVGVVVLLYAVRGVGTPGDISVALRQNPELYTLSLGHIRDLTLGAFAYLRWPLVVAGVGFLVGLVGVWRGRGMRKVVWLGVMMVVVAHGARLALVVFDPYLSSRALGEALKRAPAGELIVDDQYYAFSSVFFYAHRKGLLLNGRVNNLEYGSYAPGAPKVFIDDGEFAGLWRSGRRYYLVASASARPRLERLVGPDKLHVVASAGGNFLFSNKSMAGSA